MRRLSKMMIGLLAAATMVAPVAAQAQDRGHGGWRGGDAGAQRGSNNSGSGNMRGGNPGGGNAGGWQRGGDNRGAMMNGDARRAAVQQAREANRQVERPAPMARQQAPAVPRSDVANQGGRQWQGANRGEWNRAQQNRARGTEAGIDRRRATAEAIERQRAGDNQRGWNRDNDRRADRRDWDRNRDDNRNRNWAVERRDGDRSWTTNRRDWDRNDRRDWNRNDRRDWNSGWRNDRRYAWQSYRNQHRSIYRLAPYRERYGYSYRRWYPGYRFDPWFYSSSFWISDPWYYRLPPAYGPYRWVRYYDDVALVDIETGEIVDIIYDFFW